MTVNILWDFWVLLEPPLRNKWFRIGAPKLFITIGEDNRRMHDGSFGNKEGIQDLSRCRFNRGAQWDNIVFYRLGFVNTQHLLVQRNSHTMRIISSTGGCNLNVSWTTASRYGSPDVNWSHVGSLEANSCRCSLNLRCFSGFRANSISAHWQDIKKCHIRDNDIYVRKDWLCGSARQIAQY